MSILEKQKPGSAIDWVTATTTSAKTGSAWMETWQKHKEKNNGPVEQVRLHGFSGLRTEGLTWSMREADGRFMMVASGQVAEELWDKVNLVDAKITRVDLCVDCVLCDPRPAMAKEVYRVLSSPAWEASRTKFTLYQTSSQNKMARPGETLYCGSRASDQMGRIYDKGQQTRLAAQGVWWRYEVEYKAGRARRMAEELKDPKGRSDRIKTTVHQWFLDRFIGPGFSAGNEEGVYTRVYVAKTTNEKRLAWLESQVRPTVAYLLEVGLGKEALGALGIGHLFDTEMEGLRKDVGSRSDGQGAPGKI